MIAPQPAQRIFSDSGSPVFGLDYCAPRDWRPRREWKRFRERWPWAASLLVHAVVLIAGTVTWTAATAPPGAQSRVLSRPGDVDGKSEFLQWNVQASSADSAAGINDEAVLPHEMRRGFGGCWCFCNPMAVDVSEEIVNRGPGAFKPAPIMCLAPTPTSDYTIGLPSPSGAGWGRTNSAVVIPGEGRPNRPDLLPGIGADRSGLIPVSPGKRIAYICDANGSMMQKLDPLRVMLRKTISSLRPNQSFNVIFMQSTSCAAANRGGLLPGTPAAKQQASDFIDHSTSHGSTDPIPSLDFAFEQGVDVIELLTNGDFPDYAALMAFLRRRNADQHVRINTIAFIDPDEDYQKWLKRIAEENGGTFKFISEADLMR